MPRTKYNKKRLYHVIAINEKTGKKTIMTKTPELHSAALVIKSKINPNVKGRRIQLEEV